MHSKQKDIYNTFLTVNQKHITAFENENVLVK